jgi:hypothetical protein
MTGFMGAFIARGLMKGNIGLFMEFPILAINT